MAVNLSHNFPVSVGFHTDVGRERTNNEDSASYKWMDNTSLLLVVADGMGGHDAGEVASSLAVRVLEDLMALNLADDPRPRLYNALLEANREIMEEARRGGSPGMGTTAVVAYLNGPEAYIAQVGDSRVYHIRAGNVIWKTIDHTRVQMLVEQGVLSEEQARAHPEAGMLTRALGHPKMSDGNNLEPDVLSEPVILEDGDALLLCSDGLHDLVGDSEIAQVVAGSRAGDAAKELIAIACERGGHDNVTIGVIIAGELALSYDATLVSDPVTEFVESDLTTEIIPEADVAVHAITPQSEAPIQGDNRKIYMWVGCLLFGVLGLLSVILLAIAVLN